MVNWFLIYTKPRCEDGVSQKLGSAGFEVLNPKIKERRYLRNRVQETVSPLFPCYIFARFDIPRDYRLIKYTRGVKTIIGIEFSPSAVPDHIITQIRNRAEGGVITMPPDRFVEGENVLIMRGPLEGLEAVFEKQLKGSERVAILLRNIRARVVVDQALLARA